MSTVYSESGTGYFFDINPGPLSFGSFGYAEAFKGDGSKLDSITVSLRSSTGGGAPDSPISVSLYAAFGTAGVDAIPTGIALATASIDSTAIGAGFADYLVTFATAVQLVSGRSYVIAIEYFSATGGVDVQGVTATRANVNGANDQAFVGWIADTSTNMHAVALGSVFVPRSSFNVYLRSVPSDAALRDVRAYDPTVADSTGITADLSQTLGALTLSSTAALAIAASSSVTLGAITLSSGAALAIKGDLSKTLGAVTLASGATLGIAASESTTLGALSLSSAAALGIAAAESTTLGALASSSAAALAIAGSFAQTLGSLALSSGATLAESASEATTLGALSLASTATLAISASEATVLAALSAQSTAALAIKADLSQSLGALTMQETPSLNADLSVTLGALALSADATVPQPSTEERRVLRGKPKRVRYVRAGSSISVDEPKQPPQLSAQLVATLGELRLSATAQLGNSPVALRRMHTLTVLLS